MVVGTMGAVRLAGVKVMVDEAVGGVFPDFDQLEGVVMSAHVAGFQVALHAVEGRPLEAAVKVLASVLLKAPRFGHRHRIEHCSLCPPEVRRHLKGLGLVVVSQPGFIYQNGERYLHTVAKRAIPHLYPFGALFRDGIIVAASSDSPAGPTSPLTGISAAVTRKAGNGQIVGIEQVVEPEQALAMYTRNAAYVTFSDGTLGDLASGKLADLVVLSDDPLSCHKERIKDIRVEMTMVDGRIVYERS